jgi:hypothetical protein
MDSIENIFGTQTSAVTSDSRRIVKFPTAQKYFQASKLRAALLNRRFDVSFTPL